MCDGSDLIKQEGVFACQTCDAKYSVEEVRNLGLMYLDLDGEGVPEDYAKVAKWFHLAAVLPCRH